MLCPQPVHRVDRLSRVYGYYRGWIIWRTGPCVEFGMERENVRVASAIRAILIASGLCFQGVLHQGL
ncbi:hypothetical protein HNQ08_004961 [Deinococcus humi]|uniref:Uncharacterized protein n=1 Tax=Deinococcus humi TaxID=662880 RepID=A0A7W8NHF7_9DEIO|nr:hypothetical protein [Deinococcus humi]GGO39403.1 hypothetical protein GCM10008949_47480 [Deinococcus humi]